MAFSEIGLQPVTFHKRTGPDEMLVRGRSGSGWPAGLSSEAEMPLERDPGSTPPQKRLSPSLFIYHFLKTPLPPSPPLPSLDQKCPYPCRRAVRTKLVRSFKTKVVDPGRLYLHSARPLTTTISVLPVPLRVSRKSTEDWLTEQAPGGQKKTKDHW